MSEPHLTHKGFFDTIFIKEADFFIAWLTPKDGEISMDKDLIEIIRLGCYIADSIFVQTQCKRLLVMARIMRCKHIIEITF